MNTILIQYQYNINKVLKNMWMGNGDREIVNGEK